MIPQSMLQQFKCRPSTIKCECDREHAATLLHSVSKVVSHPLFDFGPGVLVLAGLFLPKNFGPLTVYFVVYDLSGQGTWQWDCPAHRRIRINDVRGLVDLSGVEFKEV